MTTVVPDKLLINLKILSKIQKNGRIARSYDGMISLENDSYYQPIKRFLSSDSRKQAVFEINSIITECIDTFSHILNSRHMNKMYSQTDEYFKGCENISLLLSELQSAKCGIDNLKFTYQNDPNVSSQLDIIILKITTTIRDISSKLNHLNMFLGNIDIAPNQHDENRRIREHDGTPDTQPNFDLHHVLVDSIDTSNTIVQMSPLPHDSSHV